MGVPSGQVVARPQLTRACGCVQEFQFYAVDRYRAERMAKFQQTRCPACVAKLEAERKLVGLPKKGEAFKALPAGAAVSLQLRPDGTWTGSLVADGRTVQAEEPTAGPQALVLTLTRQWLTAAAKDATPAAESPASPKT